MTKRFSQVKEIDYQETFLHVFRHKSFRILFALVAACPNKEWKKKQRELKNVFQKGNLKEEALIEHTLYTTVSEKGVKKTNFDSSIFMNKVWTIIIAAFVYYLTLVYIDERKRGVYFITWKVDSKWLEEFPLIA